METNNYQQETNFQNCFIDKKIISGCKILTTEFRLYEPYSLFKSEIRGIYDKSVKEVIGKIDVIFKYRQRTYTGEIKWTIPRNDFWDAMKIIGYNIYYNWQNETWGGFGRAYPAILIPIKHIKLEHKIVANKLKISLFGIDTHKSGYSLELTNPSFGSK